MTDSSIDVYYRDLTWSSIEAWSIKNYDFRISRSKIWPCLMYLCRVSFLTTLDIYKTYCHTQIQRPRDLFSLCEAMRLYAIGFYNLVLLDLHCWWSEKLCNLQHLFKLLKLVTYFGFFCESNGKKTTTRSSPIGYWSKGSIVSWYFKIGQGSW